MTSIQAGPPVSCGRCWAVLGRHDRFCGACGAERDTAPRGVTAASIPEPITEPIALPRHRAPVDPVRPTPLPASPSAVLSAAPPWVPWVSIAGLCAIGLAGLYSSFSGLASGVGVGVGLLDAVVVIGFVVLTGLAVRAVLTNAGEAAGLEGVVAGAALIAAVASSPNEGLGVLAGLGAIVAALGAVLLATTGAEGDPLATARLLSPVAGVGFVVLALREALEVASQPTGSGGLVSISGSLLAGVGLVAARYVIEPARRSRLVAALASLLGLVAVTSSGIGDAAGWLVVGLAGGVVTLLYLPGPARRVVGEAPLPGLVSMRTSVQELLANSSGRAARGGAPTSGLVGLLRIVPWWFWITLAVGLVVGFTGLSESSAYDAAAKACTLVDGRPISIVRDTPECDAAFAERDHGKMIMALGGLIALGPIVAVEWVKDKLARLRTT